MNYRFSRVLTCLVALGWTVVAAAAIRLPAVIGNNMVLQRGQPVPIWGWAEKGERVIVQIAGQSLSTKADDDGCWKIVLDKLEVGQPLEMTIQDESGQVITLKNILVGEVWLCSGQSNMEICVKECNHAREEIAAVDYSQIRLLNVPARGTQKPQRIFNRPWNECNPETVARFSAIAYFYGRKLHEDLRVPIGLIHCSWGASSCEAWIKRSTLEAAPQYRSMLKDWDERMRAFDQQQVEKAEQQYATWKKQVIAAEAAGKIPPESPSNLSDLYKVMFVPRQRPANCYNGMLLPLIPYAIRGAIWYQGETNAPRAHQYRHLFPLMIKQWRDDWRQGNFPFYFVQLANYRAVKKHPDESDWAELREAQTMALKLPNTGMAVTIDIGDAKDIHPKNKQEIGERLALWALAKTYGKNIVYSGPLFKFMEKKGNRIILHFDHVGTGLIAKDGEQLQGFAIAGADKIFVWAKAKIIGDTVVVGQRHFDAFRCCKFVATNAIGHQRRR